MGSELIDIAVHTEQGFRTLVKYDGWKVSCLNYAPTYSLSGLSYFEKHLETDEVFIIVKGKCLLLLGGNGGIPQDISCVPLEQEHTYNVKKGTWHTHILSEDASLFIIENADTSVNNSSRFSISDAIRLKIKNVQASLDKPMINSSSNQ